MIFQPVICETETDILHINKTSVRPQTFNRDLPLKMIVTLNWDVLDIMFIIILCYFIQLNKRVYVSL
jgi:hypothetical protein